MHIECLDDPWGGCMTSIKMMRSDHLRYTNPTPYKVSVSESLYDFIHKLWLEEAPVGEIV